MAADDADVVRVWLVRDDLPPGVALDEFAALLDGEERRRADVLMHDADRRLFVIAHCALRLIVADWLGAPPRELRWERGRHGKPALCAPWAGAEANLSHSGDLSLVAVTASRRVGVDIQHMRPGLDVTAMARRYFPPDEASFVLAPADSAARVDRFTRLWVRKEAVVKAAGGRLIPQGMAAPVLRGVHRAHEGSEAEHIAAAEQAVVDVPGDPAPNRYRVADLPAPHGFRAAVALSGAEPVHVVSLAWRWPEGAAAAAGSPTSSAARQSVSESGS